MNSRRRSEERPKRSKSLEEESPKTPKIMHTKNDRADAICRMIKNMSEKEKDKTLLALLLSNSQVMGKMERLCDDLATVNVEEILNSLGPEFRKAHKI
jgi:hypothetical protein